MEDLFCTEIYHIVVDVIHRIGKLVLSAKEFKLDFSSLISLKEYLTISNLPLLVARYIVNIPCARGACYQFLGAYLRFTVGQYILESGRIKSNLLCS